VLLAPGFKAAGINDATSDFISVFSAVVLDSNCQEAHPRGVTTPAAMTRWLQRQPGLTVAHVGRVSVGGLHGTVQDVSLAPGWKRSCYGWTYGAVPLFSGEPPSSLVHMVTAGLVMRIYLLRSSYFGRPDVLAIEINDVDPVDSLSAYTDIVETFRFGRPM
jgi:hypothetical protein